MSGQKEKLSVNEKISIACLCGQSHRCLFNCELKMTATSLCMDFTFKHIFLPSSILAAKDKLCLEKKRPQPKGRKMTLVLHNEICEVLAFLFQNLEK